MVCHFSHAVTAHQQTTFNILAAVLLASLAKDGGLLETKRKTKRKNAKQTPKYMHKTYTISPCKEKMLLYTVLINTHVYKQLAHTYFHSFMAKQF